MILKNVIVNMSKNKFNTRKGKWAENLAKDLLITQGWKIQGQNFYFRGGELDIVARDPLNVLVFVEVKSSWKAYLARPQARVSEGKQFRLWRAALAWTCQNNLMDEPSRFDVIALVKVGQSWKMEHIPHAFYGPSSTW